jgi:hypothetical protein
MPGTTSFLFSCKVVVFKMSQIIYEEKQREMARKRRMMKIMGMKREVKVGKS